VQASVHLPRMGLRGSDWYAVERAVRRYLVSHGIPTYVYYFKRGGHRPNVRASQPPASSLSLSERSMSFSQLLPSPPPPTPASLQVEVEEEEEVSLSAQRKPNKKRRLITPESDSESENFSRTAKPQNATTTKCLEGKRFYLHLVGSDYDSLCTVIKRHGGQVAHRFDKRVTHVLSSVPHASNDEIVHAAKKINPGVVLVSPGWLHGCIQAD